MKRLPGFIEQTKCPYCGKTYMVGSEIERDRVMWLKVLTIMFTATVLGLILTNFYAGIASLAATLLIYVAVELWSRRN